MSFLYGMIGAFTTVVILCAAGAIGWWLHGKAAGLKKPIPPSVEEQERNRLIAEQNAFREMMNYNVSTAYQTGRDMDEEG